MRPDDASSATTSVDVVRWESGTAAAARPDAVAVEEPLEIRVETHPVVVTMRTPGHDDELAAGFLTTEGVVKGAASIAAIRPYPRNEAGNAIDVFLAPGVAVDLKRLARNVYASSSCGICGKAAIETIRLACAPAGIGPRILVATLESLPGKLRAVQSGFDATGGLHAAAIFAENGDLLVAREDVGRHNAVDKVIGRALLDGLVPLDRHVLLVSGRVSFEIVQKALAAGITFVAGVSAPSSLGVRFASETGQTLVGFLRANRFNVYAGPERIVG